MHALQRFPLAKVILGTIISVILLSVLSCQALTSVDAPDIVQPDDYASVAGASALAAGAITQFHIAFGGTFAASGNQVVHSGLMADELAVTSSSDVDRGPWDRRDAEDPTSGTSRTYAVLHNARQRLLDAIRSFAQVAPDSGARIGQLYALLGYTSLFFGESFCAGVPLSHRDAALRPMYGQPLTTMQLFDSALSAFDSALVYGVDSARITQLARVGRGRALLSQGRFAEAAQAVAGVPTTYVYNVTYLGISGLTNGFFNLSGSPLWNRDFTVPQREGTNGLNWRTAQDPRVGLINRGLSGTQDTVYGFVPYQAANAPIRLAGGIEARLIEAEAALQANQVSTWLAIHNALRATVTWPAGQAATLADPGSPTDRVDLHFRERAFWLFLTGHRLGDLRRLVRHYGRGAETVFPTGEWRGGIQYGSAVSMAPPPSQFSNPHYTGCLSRQD